MGISGGDGNQSFCEGQALRRLDSFDPGEILEGFEFQSAAIPQHLIAFLETASQLMRQAQIQLENENFTVLEFVVHKLRGIFTYIGCNRLAFLFEKIYKNLTKLKIDYLRELFVAVSQEYIVVQKEITIFLETGLHTSEAI